MALKWKIVKVSQYLEFWFDMHFQSSISNKYFKYLSEAPEKNTLGQKHVDGLRLFFSDALDKYFLYLIIIEPKHFKSI